MTEYVVLKQVGIATKDWVEMGRVSAGGSNQAIRAILAEIPDGQQVGTFVATPSRSWRPESVAPQTQTRLVFTGPARPVVVGVAPEAVTPDAA